MDLIRISRKPYLAFFMAIAMLFISCEQYDVPEEIQKTENKFDYSVFNEFKSNSVYLDLIDEIKKDNLKNKTNSISILESNQNALYKVNSKLGTNIDLPDSFLGIENASPEKVFKKSLDNKWISKENIELIKEFNAELQLVGFDKTLMNYEKKVLNLNLTEKEFSFHNNFVNVVKGLNYLNPPMFKSTMSGTSLKSSSWWHCAASSVALASAIAGTISCLTVVACGIAMVCLYPASRSFARNCVEQ